MLKVVLGEKGGAEREMFFDGAEVTIGRVQGNGIVLPKPNVSKRHATIVARDGRVTVVDLKSTNGTYVNGRRITTPKEIKPDDRVYVGDFTMRVVLAEPGSEPVLVPAAQPVIGDDAQRRPTIAMPSLEAPPLPPDQELSTEMPPLDLDVELAPMEPSGVTPVPPLPIEPAPRAAPAKAEAGAVSQVSPAMAAWQGILEETGAEGHGPAPVAVEPAFPSAAELSQPGVGTPSRSQVSALTRRSAITTAEQPVVGSPDRYMAALRVVAARAEEEVFAGVDLLNADFPDTAWTRLSETVMQLVETLRREQQITTDADPYALTQDVLFEFTGLGPLEELFGDESVRTISIDSWDRIFVVRGMKSERAHRCFVSNATLNRVASKLCVLAGLGPNVGAHAEGRLPDGTWMTVLRPPLVPEGVVMVLERYKGSQLTVDDFVSAGMMDESAARLIRLAVRKHRNILVCGPRHSGKSVFVNALVGLVAPDERIVAVEGRRDLSLSQRDLVCLNKEALIDECRRRPCRVTRLFPDVVVVSDVGGDDVDLVTRLALSGQRGLIASTIADSAEACLRRLELLVLFANPAMREESVRAAVRQAIDLVIVLAVGEDGRSRVIEVGEVDRAMGTLKILGSAG